ncbi:facilitated trehalose transporter Tret1-like [Schistocerca piceifrons]|uniref:facilitated trehalose transporter Tret1-like n=1 Tax=Schistocerca piceifrons TaxID=274613 RepID=UPI001F5F3396|nr:facilitated trehalose transporter Tret1-like [Schistocerca piceifrons]XP_047115365.1 facilitated trehalose transporter Tret1-like [Schistocerca piceifrons]XP_047115366.1 facilitated trehalose transporter Tret1-like [Schistocerca piceifrons]
MRLPFTGTLQYIAAFTATLSYLSCGMLAGWTSPMLPRLREPGSHLPLTADEASWVVSATSMVMPLPVLLVPFVVDVVGRKTLLVASAVPVFASWLMVLFAESAAMLIASRLVASLGVGAVMCVGPMYVCEVAEARVRGALGTLFQFMLSAGSLLAFSLGPYLSYEAVAIACAAVPVVFLACFVWMPESPYFFALRGRDEEAERVLRRLRGSVPEEDIAQELAVVRKCVEQQKGCRQSWLQLLGQLVRRRGSRRALVVCVGLMLAQVCTGLATLLGYTTEVFQRSGAALDADVCSIVVAAVQVATSVAAALLADRAGRRPLLLLSCAGCALTIAAEGVFFYLKDVVRADLSDVQWLPLTAFLGFLVFNILGLGPVPWAMVGEVFPSEVKGLATAIVTVVLSVSSTAVAKLFQVVSDQVGMHVVFFSFSACAAAGLVFTYFCVPETKGRSFLEIMRHFEGDATESPESTEKQPPAVPQHPQHPALHL